MSVVENFHRIKCAAKSRLDRFSPFRAYPKNKYTEGMAKAKNIQPKPKRTHERRPNNRTTTGFRVSDELWSVPHPLLPDHVNKHRFGGGRPRVADRRCADAIFYVLRTGGQWEALNQTALCAKSTTHDRFQEWVRWGVSALVAGRRGTV